MECDSWHAIDIAGLEQHDPSMCDQTDMPKLSFIGGWSCDKVSSTYRLPNSKQEIFPSAVNISEREMTRKKNTRCF